VTLALDYLARPLRRRIVVETVRHSFVLDLASGRLAVDGAVEVFAADTDGMLAEMHRAVINNAGGYCTAEEGIAVVEMIAAIEAARDCGTWVEEGFAA